MRTQGRLEMQTPFTDGQEFARNFSWVGTAPTPTSPSAGLYYNALTGAATYNGFISIGQILRTGQLATAAVNQQQFGTAALVPGPSSVANTSDPADLPPGFPPLLSAQNPTLTGGYKGPIPKGYQINWIDSIYEVDTLALTSVTLGLTQTKFAAAGASATPVVTNIIALGANGLPTATNTAGQATRTRVSVASPAFSIADGSEIILNINFVLPATSTAKFYGCILGLSFNYN